MTQTTKKTRGSNKAMTFAQARNTQRKFANRGWVAPTQVRRDPDTNKFAMKFSFTLDSKRG